MSETGAGRKLQVGLYDNQILCESCENALGIYDDYAGRVLIHRQGSDFIPITDTSFIYSFTAVNRRLLRGFLASLLFRMSVTKQEEFAETSIGDVYEKRIAEDIRSNGTFNYIDASIIRVENELAFMATTPIRCRFGHVNGFRFQLPHYAILLSLDKRPNPHVCHCFHPFLAKCSGSTSLSEIDSSLPYWIIGSNRMMLNLRQLSSFAKQYTENRDTFRKRNKC